VAVRLAQDQAAKSDIAARLRFKKASIEKTGLATGSAAAIVAIDSIYFLRNRPAVASEVTRLLRPGGVLIATTFESPPVSARDLSWHGAFVRQGFAVAQKRDVTRSWRAYMVGKHTLRWNARDLLLERCGPNVEPHLEVSQTIVETAGECLAHLRRFELCLQKPVDAPMAAARPSSRSRAVPALSRPLQPASASSSAV
jgi:hypothetical protein